MTKHLTRRQFIVTTTALACATVTHRRAMAAAKPNILLIHADQHRMECLGAYGNADIKTPHIDALAADGVRYENSFCPYPVCTPSRYSLLSGQYVHEHEGWSNHCTLKPGTDTFATLLRKTGYQTKCVGKMHFAPTYLDVGFDEMLLSEQNGPGRWDDDYHRELKAEGLIDRNDAEDQLKAYRQQAEPEYWDSSGTMPSNLPLRYHSTQWIGDKCATEVASWNEGGHLLMAGFIKPHHPFDPPADHCDWYDPDALTLLPGWTEQCLDIDLKLSKGFFPHEKLTEAKLRKSMAYYYAMIQHIDEQVGRLVTLLKEKGLYDNTMIIYTSDHGDYMGFHHMLLKGNYVYDPLVKVPLIIKYPQSQRKGTVSKALVSNVDVAPTISRQAGCQPSDSMSGVDLAASDPTRDIVFCENKSGAHCMARSHTRKLIWSKRKGRSLFFDLEKDPQEMNNRYGDPAYRKEIRKYKEAIVTFRGEPRASKPYLDENAPIIQQPNVPTRNDGHRDAMQAYYAAKMKEV